MNYYCFWLCVIMPCFCFSYPSPEVDNYHCGSSCVAGHFSVGYWTFRWAEIRAAQEAAALKCK